MHQHRTEHWVVVQGTARIACGNSGKSCEDQSTYIPLGTPHRLENPGKIPLQVIEVQSGSYPGEDDIVRSEDHYDGNRAATAAVCARSGGVFSQPPMLSYDGGQARSGISGRDA